ncbi:kinase-like protein [Phanerochaete sordida]|uniref:non-specific serine/threonine protein kinase n=1 Tax=Phanerochaete sordida TaxID=48140 RepID=A0A9P3GHM1_9APHY|nr:kinase-like protein [Phanerochaete sordida]
MANMKIITRIKSMFFRKRHARALHAEGLKLELEGQATESTTTIAAINNEIPKLDKDEKRGRARLKASVSLQALPVRRHPCTSIKSHNHRRIRSAVSLGVNLAELANLALVPYTLNDLCPAPSLLEHDVQTMSCAETQHALEPSALLPAIEVSDAHTPSSLSAPAFASTKRAVTIHDFALTCNVSSGPWGWISGALHKPTGTCVVVKAAKKREKPTQSVLNEQAVLRALSGTPHVLSLLASFHDRDYFYVVTPYCEQGDLGLFLKKYFPLDPAMLHYWAAQLLSGLESIHAHGIIHRDLRPANIFITRGRLVIGGLGLAHPAAARAAPAGACGALAYRAPELWDGARCAGASDVWACAVTLFEMAAGRVPLDPYDYATPEAYRTILFGGTLDEWLGGDEVPAELHALLNSVFKASSAWRPSALRLKHHPYFYDVYWAAMDAGAIENPCIDDFEDSEDTRYTIDQSTPLSGAPPLCASHDSHPDFTYVSDALASPTADCAPVAPASCTATPELVDDFLPSPSPTGCDTAPATPTDDLYAWGTTVPLTTAHLCPDLSTAEPGIFAAKSGDNGKVCGAHAPGSQAGSRAPRELRHCCDSWDGAWLAQVTGEHGDVTLLSSGSRGTGSKTGAGLAEIGDWGGYAAAVV